MFLMAFDVKNARSTSRRRLSFTSWSSGCRREPTMSNHLQHAMCGPPGPRSAGRGTHTGVRDHVFDLSQCSQARGHACKSHDRVVAKSVGGVSTRGSSVSSVMQHGDWFRTFVLLDAADSAPPLAPPSRASHGRAPKRHVAGIEVGLDVWRLPVAEHVCIVVNVRVRQRRGDRRRLGLRCTSLSGRWRKRHVALL